MSTGAAEVRVEVLPDGVGLGLPSYQTAGSAGCDLRAAIQQPLPLEPGARMLVPCGFRMALPDGVMADVRPRSGLALRHGVTVLNAPGTIDSDYRGEVKVLLVNLGEETFVVERGLRVAQLVLARYVQAAWVEGPLDETARGDGGFGSTGTA